MVIGFGDVAVYRLVSVFLKGGGGVGVGRAVVLISEGGLYIRGSGGIEMSCYEKVGEDEVNVLIFVMAIWWGRESLGIKGHKQGSNFSESGMVMGELRVGFWFLREGGCCTLERMEKGLMPWFQKLSL